MTLAQQKIAEAIKNLRLHFGDSQQQFSQRIGVVVRTVARWELEKPPRGDTLVQLHGLAERAGRLDLADIFLEGIASIPPGVLYARAVMTFLSHPIAGLSQIVEQIDHDIAEFKAPNERETLIEVLVSTQNRVREIRDELILLTKHLPEQYEPSPERDPSASHRDESEES